MPLDPEVLKAYLDGRDDDQRDLAISLHSLVHEADDELKDSLKWGNLTFENDRKRNRIAIVAHKKHVNLQFWKGIELPDPDGLLEGSGKAMRHVKIRKQADIEEHRGALIALVRAHAEADR